MTLRAIDGNGFVPDEANGKQDAKQTGSTLLTDEIGTHVPIGENDNTLDVCPACRREAKLASIRESLGRIFAELAIIGKQVADLEARPE